MRLKLIFTITFLICFLTISAQDWLSKIDPALWQQATDEGTVDFLIVLHEQADVSDAIFLPKKEDKGAFVFQQLTELAARTQERVLQTLADFQAPHRPFYVLNAVWAEGGPDLLEAIARLPEVAEIHVNPEVRLEQPVREDNGGDRVVEWGILNINADDVWAMGYTGSGVVVGGQDTGYDWDVPALKLKYRGWDNTTMTADHNYHWHDAIHSNAGSNDCGVNSPEPCDDHNHGTHTMGTMVGEDGINEIGVAPDAKWMGCRNMDNGNGTPATYIECFEWFLAPTDLNDQNPDPSMAPHVINNSWACPPSEGCNPGNFSDMETAVNNLTAAGIVVVASAGNSGSSCSTVNAPPAIFAESFSVGATNSSNAIAGFSSRGPVTVDGSNRRKPDVSAPGVSVRSCIRNGAYATYSGTSMAGPHVAGAIALLISADPSLAGQVAQIESFFETTGGGQTTNDGCGGDTPTTTPNNTYGYGIIDAEAAVNAAMATVPVELISFTGTLTDGQVQLNWEVALLGTLNHFEVEKSDSRLDWEILDKLPFLPSKARYSLTDENPVPGVNYYRLKMVDLDGSIEYSKVISVGLSERNSLTVFPNPAHTELSLLADWQPGEVTIYLMDAVGRVVQRSVFTISSSQANLTLPLADLAEGIYLVRVVNGGDLIFQSRFVKN